VFFYFSSCFCTIPHSVIETSESDGWSSIEGVLRLFNASLPSNEHSCCTYFLFLFIDTFSHTARRPRPNRSMRSLLLHQLTGLTLQGSCASAAAGCAPLRG